MKYLTKKVVESKLRAIQNRFNADILTEDELLLTVYKVMHDFKKGKKRSRRMKELFLNMKIDDYSRELVKEYDHVVVSKNPFDKFFIQIKRYGKLYRGVEIFVSERNNRTIDTVYETAEEMNKIYADKCHTSTVEFPTGNVIFANFFKNSSNDSYAFDMPKDLKYSEEYSINNDIGTQKTMRKLSEVHGLAYIQLGNTSAHVYKVGEDRIVIAPAFAYYEDDDGYEHDMPEPSGWELMGEICCDVWRVEFIDQQNFDKGDTLPLDHEDYEYNKPFHCSVNPGIWEIKNRYHFMDDRVEIKNGLFPVWCEITRKGDN